MSLIDWSDPEEMLGLLIDYVADERIGEEDEERASFLRDLSGELEDVARKPFVTVDAIADAICEVRAGQSTEFRDDAVLAHVDACVEELRRIGAHAQGQAASSRSPRTPRAS